MIWVCVAGVVSVAVSAVLVVEECSWLSRARTGEGVVVELVASSSSRRSTYAPRVRFVAPDGSQHEFVRGYSSSPCGYSVGDRVRVAYQGDTHAGRLLSFSERFGAATVFGIVGLALLAGAACFAIGPQVLMRFYPA